VLIAGQAILLACSIVPVFLFLRTRLPFGPALTLAAAYAVFWGIQQTAVSDVHEMAFAPLLVASIIYAMDQHRWGIFWTSCVLLSMVKEDLIPLLAAVGLYLVLSGERWRGALLMTGALAAFFLVVGVIVPSFNDTGRYSYGGAYYDVLRRPWALPETLVTPIHKVRTMLLWFAPFVFLSLRSPLCLLLLPLALERFASESPTHWGTAFHYSAPVAPIVAMSAGDGLARIAKGMEGERARRLLAAVAAMCLIASSLLPGKQPLWRLFTPAHYVMSPFVRTGYRALGHVPPDASVVAQAALLPQLSQRHHVYVLEHEAPELDADFVIACAHLSPWPLSSNEELTQLLEGRRRRGYSVVFEEDGWTVLRR
jgi:uncharacterized membrane protein